MLRQQATIFAITQTAVIGEVAEKISGLTLVFPPILFVWTRKVRAGRPNGHVRLSTEHVVVSYG
jgi:hypothetical protein